MKFIARIDEAGKIFPILNYQDNIPTIAEVYSQDVFTEEGLLQHIDRIEDTRAIYRYAEENTLLLYTKSYQMML